METQSIVFAGIITLLVFGALSIVLYSGVNKDKYSKITTFDECVSAGLPVAESYPRQCKAGAKTFVEVIPMPVVTPPQNTTPTTTDVSDLIRVFSPEPNARISSPLTVRGEARGNWYFEASFPIELLGPNGERLLMEPVQADGEWMTEDFVPFSKILTFATSTKGIGALILHKDNPSGLPEHDRSIKIPIIFD